MSNEDDQATKIKTLLAAHIGVESDDISQEDFLAEDLHMTPTDLTDFAQVLESAGFNTTKLDFRELETIGDLIEALTFHEEIK